MKKSCIYDIYIPRNILKENIEKLKNYEINKSRPLTSLEAFLKDIDKKSQIEIQKKFDLMKKLSNRYGVLLIIKYLI